jgi:hypothetical protein
MNAKHITELLLKKSVLKQQVYLQTLTEFKKLKKIAFDICDEINESKELEIKNVFVKVYDKGEFEFHLKFGSDTLVFMMHTNIFSLAADHYIFDTEYVKSDKTRAYCGMIQVYNFLSDSLKYNRENDIGYLLARIFINKDLHFFIEGKRSLALAYNDFGCCTLENDTLKKVIIELMQYCINFDLIAPPLELVNIISVEQKNSLSYSSGMPTGKRLGFTMHTDKDID